MHGSQMNSRIIDKSLLHFKHKIKRDRESNSLTLNKALSDITWPNSLPTTPRHNVIPLFYSVCLRQLLLTVHCYLSVLECLTSRTASFGLEEEKNVAAACLPGSIFLMSTCFVLKTELNMTLHVVQTVLPTIPPISYVPGSHYKHSRAPVKCTGLLSSTPSVQKYSFLH